jgi:hypothetical protein
MKYQVTIPKPSAKRLKNAKLVIESSDGWVAYKLKIYDLAPNQTSFEFEMPDDVDYQYDTDWIDGSTFNIYVEFSNDIGSRQEKVNLVPMKI